MDISFQPPPSRRVPVLITAAIIIGTTIGTNNIGIMISRDLVLVAIAEKNVPIDEKPMVVSRITPNIRKSNKGTLKRTEKSGIMINSEAEIKMKVEITFDRYMFSRLTGDNNIPLIVSFSCSRTNKRVKPNIPEKIKVIQRIPGAKLRIV